MSLKPLSTHLPQLTPPLSTVDWFQIQKSPNFSLKKNFINIVVTFELMVKLLWPSRFKIHKTLSTYFIFQKTWYFGCYWQLQLYDRQTHKQTDRYGDSMTDSALRAEMMKIVFITSPYSGPRVKWNMNRKLANCIIGFMEISYNLIMHLSMQNIFF